MFFFKKIKHEGGMRVEVLNIKSEQKWMQLVAPHEE